MFICIDIHLWILIYSLGFQLLLSLILIWQLLHIWPVRTLQPGPPVPLTHPIIISIFSGFLVKEEFCRLIWYLFLFNLRVSHFAKETWFLLVYIYTYTVIHKYDNTHIFIIYIYITFLGIMMFTKAFLELYMYIYPSLLSWDGNIGLLFSIQWHFPFNFYHDQQQHPWSTCVQWQ